MPKRPEGNLLSRGEATIFLAQRGYKLAYTTLQTYISRGNGPPCITVENRAWYDPAELLAWAEKRQPGGKPVGMGKPGRNGHSFKKGYDPNRGGRGKKKGGGNVLNNGQVRTVPRALKEMVLEALNGPKLKGILYLEWLAQDHPTCFTTLLAKILPTQVDATVKRDVRDLSTADILDALAAQGVTGEEASGDEPSSIH